MYAQSGRIVHDALFRVPLGYNFTYCIRCKVSYIYLTLIFFCTVILYLFNNSIVTDVIVLAVRAEVHEFDQILYMYTLVIYCLSTDHAPLRSNSNVWFVTSHGVSVWTYMSTCGLFFQSSNIKINASVFVMYKTYNMSSKKRCII